MSDLSFSDRQSLVAQQAGLENWCIRDMYDDRFIYRDEKTNKLYSRSYVIADGKVTLGDKVQVVQKTEYEPISVAAFSMDDATVEFGENEVLMTGKLFEAGSYPDKNFSITEDELADAASNFKPVQNDLEHKATILSGSLGQLRSVMAKGKELFGTVAIPKWLYDASGKKSIPTSLAWAKDTKRIVGNALVLKPRITDAQLVAAFSAAQTHGGVEVPVTKTKSKPGWFEKMKSLFSAGQLPDGMDDFDPEAVTFSEGETTSPITQESAKTETTIAEQAPTANFNIGLQARLLTADAEKFADEAIKAGKAYPAQRDMLVAQFKQAVEDDNEGVACFSDEGELKEGKRVKLLRDSIEAAEAHKLFGEAIPGTDDSNMIALFANCDTGKKSTDEMLITTELGKRAANLKKGAN